MLVKPKHVQNYMKMLKQMQINLYLYAHAYGFIRYLYLQVGHMAEEFGRQC